MTERYVTMFELKEYRGGGKWSIDEIEGMFPFELDLFVEMTKNRIQERRQAAENGAK